MNITNNRRQLRQYARQWMLRTAIGLMLVGSSVATFAQEYQPETAINKIDGAKKLEKEATIASEAALQQRITDLEQRLLLLEQQLLTMTGQKASAATAAKIVPTTTSNSARPDMNNDGRSPAITEQVGSASESGAASGQGTAAQLSDFFRDTTINLTLDGYYGYNFNRPINRTNALRAYDISSNSFSLNQAILVIEQAPNLAVGRRLGVRLDLQYGQATDVLQGSAANEQRPQVYRPLFQAYGTYIVPIGKGVTVDFGKFASSLGIESNFTKDQINYSRSYLFNFLPFYHFGFRSTYNVNERFAVTYWLVNGVQQSEDSNGFKSQAVILTLQPHKNITANVNYYTGIESPAPQAAAGKQWSNIANSRGRTHILDTYASWQIKPQLMIALEADYVISRQDSFAAPRTVGAGALYGRYQILPQWAIGARAEYVGDQAGLFTGQAQAVKEVTVTLEHKPRAGFLVRGEYRRDFSNQKFFVTNEPGLLKKEQQTLTLGLVWWIGK